MGEDSADGLCSYKGNNTFLMTINGSDANDSCYSRIYLASIMIHEAFHAKLRQKALETFGEATIAQWPKPIDDMTLSELASYFEADSKADNIWEATGRQRHRALRSPHVHGPPKLHPVPGASRCDRSERQLSGVLGRIKRRGEVLGLTHLSI